MTAVKLCCAALLLSVCAFVLKKSGFGGDRVFALVGTVGLLIFATEGAGTLLKGINGDTYVEEVRAIMKIIGLGYVFGICHDICAELGEGGVGAALLVAGRVEIMLIALPYLKELFSLCAGLLSA